MAKSSSLVSHIEAFVDTSRASKQQAASISAIALLVKNKVLTLEALAREMEMYLTTSDHVIRSRGTLLLAEILTYLVSEPLESTAISSFVGFFTSKLADWHVLHGALIGSLTLLRRKSSFGVVSDSDARVLVETFLSNVSVQSLALKDRMLCFEVLLCLLEFYPEAVKAMGELVVYQVCEAIDQEKDPRCLMLTFHVVEILVPLFPDSSGPVAAYSEDFFDMLGSYFPIDFTHPNDDFVVKRDDLAGALLRAFCSTPYFEPFAIPLLLDKLSSSLQLAKLDSLKYLNSCILHYGADRMAKHARTIWSSLKDLIFNHSPEAPLFSSTLELVGDTKFHDKQIVKEALCCLHTAILHLDGPNSDAFIGLILLDDDIEKVFASVSHERSSRISGEREHQLRALGSIISVASKVSISCCNRVFQKFFLRLMDVLGVSTRLNFGALYLFVELLESCRDLSVSSQDFSQQLVSSEDSWCYNMLQKFSNPLTNVLKLVLLTSRSIEETQDSDPGNCCYAVKVLQLLATFPGYHLPMSKEFYEDMLATLVSVITDQSEATFLWKETLKALVQIGSFIEKNQDSQRGISYSKIVVERIISLLQLDDSNMSLTRKLEAISRIGIAGLDYMSRVIRGLEEAIFSNYSKACVEGNTKDSEILVPLLECYSKQVLPWCRMSGNFESLVNFAFNIWNLTENTTAFNICFNRQAILDSTMMTLKLVVGGCTEENQRLIVENAYNIVSSMDFFSRKESVPPSSNNLDSFEFIPDVGDLSFRDQWVMSLFSSVVVALRPETPLPDPKIVMELLVVFLLKGHVSAAHALASMVNKWKDSSAFTLEEAIGMLSGRSLSSVLFSSSLKDHNFPSAMQIHAAVGLAWIGKGLLMRGHGKVKEIAMLLLRCLLSQDEPESGEHGHSLVMRSAADAFQIFLSDSEFCLNKEFHAIIRPLYKQRFSSIMMPMLISLIKESDPSRSREFIYQAFGHIISDTPLAAVVTEAKKVIPSLLDALSALCSDSVNKDLLYSILLVLAGILMDENGKEAIVENTHTVINHLTRLVSYPHMTLVRETAIQCLVAMSGLPHTRIYPMRPQVRKVVTKALDDRKRIVRQEAVKCRQAWAF